jgi:thiol-disulfide isomerase/thioredoxin
MKTRRLLLAAMLVGMSSSVLCAVATTRSTAQQAVTTADRLAVEGTMPSLGGALAWLNSPPLTVEGLRGKVVLVDFWTYTCVNWRRTLPYVRAWAAKYRDQGLVVIGVHTPEFEFEKNVDNVRWAIGDMKVDYPVAIDRDYRIWGAFRNQYWPALYIVDGQGRIRHHQFGEGEYEQAERVIQNLLIEAGATLPDRQLVSVNPEGAEVAADEADLRSPESYLDTEKGQNFVAVGGATVGKRRAYALPSRLTLNHWAVSGDWTIGDRAAALNAPGGRIAYRFHARDVNLVMGPAAPGNRVRFRVLIDGQPAGPVHGSDIDEQGNGTVVEQRLYQLLRQPKPIADRVFEIEFLDPGVEAFDFTFG